MLRNSGVFEHDRRWIVVAETWMVLSEENIAELRARMETVAAATGAAFSGESQRISITT